MAGLAPAAVWRDALSYAPLLDADRCFFAWEWLRRSPHYQAAYQARGSDASMFGLVTFEDPAQPCPLARPMWLADAWPSVVRCQIGRGDQVDWASLRWPLTIVAGDAHRHFLLSDGLRQVRIDVAGDTPDIRFAPCFELADVSRLGSQLATLKRLQQLISGTMPPPSPASRRAGRWVAALRVHDALHGGATYREIAGILFGEQTVSPRWWLESPSWGLRIQRLATASRAALAAGPQPWLCS